jgi:FkbM family methyltransferase
MPQYLVKQIELIKDDCEVYCVEWGDVTGGVLVVQRNKMVNLLGDRLITLGEDKYELFNVINKIQPDVIHLQEIPELFMERGVADKLYSKDRNYVIIETSHDSGYDPNNNKLYLPDKFLMVSQYQANLYKDIDIPCDIVEYPIETKVRTKTREQALRDLGLDPTLKHIINVGLFTPRKNQAEVVEYARMLQNYPIQFHFIGNHADNFKFYWEPLIQNFPSNCKWWNERSDVDSFYEAADLFLFTSRGNSTDHETMPLVIREALSWKTPSLIYNLPVYMGYFDEYDTIEYLTENTSQNAYRIAEKLLMGNINVHVEERPIHTMNGEEYLSSFKYSNTADEAGRTYGDAAGQYFATFIEKELDRDNVQVTPGDVFVDLGGNIGMSSLYAERRGAKEIYAFEPDPNMRSLFNKNVPTATVYPFAMSNKKEEIELYHWPHNPNNIGPKYKTSTVTLKDVLHMVGKKIDYLKIDIEGFEDTVFDEMTLEECEQIDKMMIEHHNYETLDDFCTKLRRLGFKIVHINRGYQAYVYAKYVGVHNKFDCTLDTQEQKVHYAPLTILKGKIIVSVKDIDSHAVIWSVSHDELLLGTSFWILPSPKHILNFESESTFGGVRVEFYLDGNLIQYNEFRLRTPSTEKPKLNLVNHTHPNYANYCEFFVEKIYDKYLKGKTFDTVVDVGANIGVWTEYIRHVANVGKVYMVEPNHEALQVLKNCFVDDSTTIVEKAMSDLDGQLEFYVDSSNSLISSIANYDQFQSVSYKVDSISMHSFMKQYNLTKIDLLKVDIESGEYPLFDSLSIEDLNKIDNILMEFHVFAGKTFENDVMQLVEKLKTVYSVEVHRLHDKGGYIFASKNNSPKHKETNTVIMLYSDKEFEPLAQNCIHSLGTGLTDTTIVYFTIGFHSDFKHENVHTIYHPIDKNKLSYNFYKPELCMKVMDMFPAEHYIYTDVDILFSRKFSLDKVKHNNSYPLASFGPVEFPFMWIYSNGNKITYTEEHLMQYYNVQTRTQRYVWSCFFSFNKSCRDFFEEFLSICENKYLSKELNKYFPFKDETAFNVCLWKRNAEMNLGFAFVNTHLLQTVKEVEEGNIQQTLTDRIVDNHGIKWEYIDNSRNVLFYHGFKNTHDMKEILTYLRSQNE